MARFTEETSCKSRRKTLAKTYTKHKWLAKRTIRFLGVKCDVPVHERTTSSQMMKERLEDFEYPTRLSPNPDDEIRWDPVVHGLAEVDSETSDDSGSDVEVIVESDSESDVEIRVEEAPEEVDDDATEFQ